MKTKEERSAINSRNALIGGGRPKGSFAVHTLEAQEARKWAIAFVNKRLTPLFEAMYKKAIDGDVMAFKELMDRSWGKAVQGVEVSGANGNPIVFMPLELIQKHSLKVIEGKVTPALDEPVKAESEKEG